MTQFHWSNANPNDRVQSLKQRLDDKADDVENVFTQLFHCKADLAKTNATAPLSGALVSVKDLFDVEGYVTRAGSVFMANTPPAPQDAPAIAKLRQSGASLVGHTNMTELAYSGLGLNPHYGTPKNAQNPDAIPGGSTSGGAVSVALGLVDIAIGTDTGGSLRIPAAFNGIVGFKPTQSTVSRQGCKALSQSLDSVGPMAKTVAECRLAYQVMRHSNPRADVLVRKFIVPTNFGFDDIEPEILSAFDLAIERIRAMGFSVTYQSLDVLDRYKTLPVWQFAAVESRREYENEFQTQRDKIDPRVSSRMARADEVKDSDFVDTLSLRDSLIAEFEQELRSQILLMPTTPIKPPLFSQVASDDEFGRLNLLALRNPSVANVMNGCSISLPIGPSDVQAGIMLTAGANRDLALLDVAQTLEAELPGSPEGS